VTGGSEGIGFAITERLLREGAYVLFTGRDSGRLDRAASLLRKAEPGRVKRMLPFRANANGKHKAEETVGEALKRFGEIDILINNVGLLVGKSISKSNVEDFDREFGMNVRSAIAHSHAVLGSMIQKQRGVIICIASVSSVLPVPDCSLYSPAKAALVMYARTLASEVARHHIRVNCVSPGPIDTPIFGKMLKSDPTDFKQNLRARIPLHRLGSPTEVANAVIFLVSEESSWITGTNLVIDGGRTVFSSLAEVFSASKS
jgi:NAD(P)-dependent dehydrogenase (short-subunit alcohol dehydrogenase family)